MDYIQQLNAFELWCETNYLPGLSQLIWYKLFMLFNRCGWAEWVTVDNLRLMALVDTRSETTFISNRDKLIGAGLIKFKKGKKGTPNKYKMIILYTPKNEANIEYKYKDVNCTPYNGANTELIRSENASQNGVNSTDINKLNKTKQKQNKELKDICPAEPSKKSKFIKPTAAEIENYCLERNNGLDAQLIFDHYEANNWYRGKTKISNWKACVRTWEKKQQTNKNTQQASGNPFLDFAKEGIFDE